MIGHGLGSKPCTPPATHVHGYPHVAMGLVNRKNEFNKKKLIPEGPPMEFFDHAHFPP